MARRLSCVCNDGTCHGKLARVKSGSAVAEANLDMHIRNPVGRRGVQQGPDVKTVQAFLNRIPERLGGPSTPLKVDGFIGPLTLGVIEAFQRRHFGSDKADGTVEVEKRTHAKISSLQAPKLERVERTRGRLKSAELCIRAAQVTIDKARVELLGASALGGSALARLNRHFSLSAEPDASAALNFIAKVYADMNSIFNPLRESPFGADPFTQFFEGEPFSNPTYGAFTTFNGLRETGVFGDVFDNGVELKWFRHDTVYLSAGLDVMSDRFATGAIVHELAHFVGPAFGHGEVSDQNDSYGSADNPKITRLSSSQKRHCAECYANMAFEVQFGGSFRA